MSKGTKLDPEAATLDAGVGANIRLRRRLLGMNQGDLARRLGLTFQQVQKYERGVNRVAASTLWRLAGALDCQVGALFEGLPPPAATRMTGGGGRGRRPEDVVTAMLAADGGHALATAFLRMSSERRRALVAAARALARDDQAALNGRRG